MLIPCLCFENLILNWAFTKECLELKNQEGKHKIIKVFLFILKKPYCCWFQIKGSTCGLRAPSQPEHALLMKSHAFSPFWSPVWSGNTHRICPQMLICCIEHWHQLVLSSFSLFWTGGWSTWSLEASFIFTYYSVPVTQFTSRTVFVLRYWSQCNWETG